VLYWIMMVPEMCASGGLSAPNAIQGAVYLCGTQASCDHLFDTQGSKADYTRGLAVRLCRFLNMNFHEKALFVKADVAAPSRSSDTTPCPSRYASIRTVGEPFFRWLGAL
jgi:hypothetical protein